MKKNKINITKAIDDFFKEMLEKDKEYLDNVSDSFVFDAEDWFYKKYNIQNWNNPVDEANTVTYFRNKVYYKFKELYKEKYGKRDSKYILKGLKYDLEKIQKDFKEVSEYISRKDAINFQIYLHDAIETLKENIK